MTKAPEEGLIWEWRAFGRIPAQLAEKIKSHPVRMGISDQRGEDIYLISPTTDQNVKLRRWGAEWLLKFKLLLATGPRLIELYSETAQMVFSFPVPRDALEQAARLLAVKLPEDPDRESFDEDEFVQALVSSAPEARKVEVGKVRSQYDFDGGWVELAQVGLPRGRVESLSIQSYEVEAVENILDLLNPGPELEPMNYVEACRRWS
jgi:hypothetical protein